MTENLMEDENLFQVHTESSFFPSFISFTSCFTVYFLPVQERDTQCCQQGHPSSLPSMLTHPIILLMYPPSLTYIFTFFYATLHSHPNLFLSFSVKKNLIFSLRLQKRHLASFFLHCLAVNTWKEFPNEKYLDLGVCLKYDISE